MNAEQKHTPESEERGAGGATERPWRIDPNYVCDIIGGDGRDVAETRLSPGYVRDKDEREANAALIVRAVNSYDQMREALERAAAELDAAAEDIKEWGAYAGEYFQEKWNLAANIQRVKEQATTARAALDAAGDGIRP